MNATSLNGDDTLQLANRTIVGFGTGDYFKLEFPSDSADMVTGKNGNTAIVQNAKGRMSVGTLRLLRGTADDAFFQDLFDTQQKDFAAAIVVNGQYVKRIGDGAGSIRLDTMKMRSGIITKRIEAKSNAEGETEQAFSVYTFKFARAGRSLM
jgi:hypothetical protein